MRTMIALLAFLSVTAFAQPIPPMPMPVYPRLYVSGNSVMVEAWNNNRMSVFCSGSVWMRMDNGQTDSDHVSMFVPAMGYRSQRVYSREVSARILSADHSIWCN